MPKSRRLSPIFALLIAIVAVGCAEEIDFNDPRLQAERAKFLLDSEPPDALGVIDLREELTEPRDVVVVGQIGGVDDPWTKNQASFVIVDPSFLMEMAADDHHHDGECEGCPYCAKKKQQVLDAVALIEFVDAAGNVIPHDARRLFELSESQMVVVRGRASMNDFGHLVIAANGLYVRR